MITIYDYNAQILSEVNCDSWYDRLIHCWYEKLMESVSRLHGIDLQEIKKDPMLCYDCVFIKAVRASRNLNDKTLHYVVTTRAVDKTQTDVIGPMKRLSSRKARYFLTALEKHTGCSSISSIHVKGKTAHSVVQKFREIVNLFNSKTSPVISVNQNVEKRIRSGDSGEYLGHIFCKCLK